MSDKNNLGRFAINANLEGLQDIYDIEDAVDTIVAGLMESDDVPLDVWLGLELLRHRLDALRVRSSLVPVVIRQICPDSHKPEKLPTS